MPGLLSGALENKAFMAISLLLLPALSAQAVDFDSALREGKVHGTEILLKHEDALKPSGVTPEAVPGYDAAAQERLREKGKRWTEYPEEMRTGGGETISGEDSGTSDATGFLKKSSAQRPVFTIDPETDPMMQTSKEAMESAAPQCDRKELCVEYTDASWEKREECYEEASLESGACEIRKNVVVTENSETWRYMTLEIDRNDAGAGFSAEIDTDGDGVGDVTVSAAACLDRQRGEIWGDFGGVTLGGPYWKECFALDGSGNFVAQPDETCVSAFGPAAESGKLPLGDSQNAGLQNALFGALRLKFPPPAGSSAEAIIEARWDRARRCREGDGDGNGWRVAFTARRTVSRADISTENRCGDYEANPKCELAGNLCVASTVTPEGEAVCTNMRMTYRCAGPPVEGPDCAALRAEGCYQTGANCVMWSREHPEEPDPLGTDLGNCLVYENSYECPKELRLCGRKKEVFECDAEIRCASGGDCFDTATERSVDFPKSASRMAMLSDMERCLATTADGQSSEDGYAPLPVDEAGGETAAPIDCADTAGGEVTVFKGKRYRCDINLAGAVQNCCRKKGLFAGSCPRSTRELRARRDDAGACHYVGIHKKKALGITLKKRKVYCCFNSKMARVIHEQARGQLIEKGLWSVAENGGWGKPKNPFCGGITTEQLQEIDFDAVDFSEIYEDILGEADMPDLDGRTRSVEESAEKLCPSGSDRLECAGEDEQ